MMIHSFDAIKAINRHRKDAIVVSTMTPTQYWVEVSNKSNLDLPIFGAMGKASSVGLGLALSRPDKKVLVFSLPGAFTPTCSTKQLPAYDEAYDRFKGLGIDEVYCVSVNDGFVMNAWGKDLGIKNVKLLADGNGDFTQAMGMLVRKRHVGFNTRSWRYAIYVINGIVDQAFIEEGYNHDGSDNDPYTVSDPETVINYIETTLR